MKIFNKKITRLFVLVLLMAYFSCYYSVNAVTPDTSDIKIDEETQLESLQCKDVKEKDYKDVYAFEEKLNNNTYTFSYKINSREGMEDLPDEYKIIRIIETNMAQEIISYHSILKNGRPSTATIWNDYNTEYDINMHFGDAANKRLTSNNKIKVTFDSSTSRRVYIIFASTHYDPGFNKACSMKKAPFIQVRVVDIYAGGRIVTAPTSYGFSNPNAEIKAIDCNNYKSKYTNTESFEYKYCTDLDNAETAVKNGTAKKITFGFSEKNKLITYEDHIKNNPNDKLSAFQCDPFENLPSHIVAEDGYYQKQNTKYVIGTVSQKIPVGYYEFNLGGYDPETKKYRTRKTEDILCQIDCTEVVTVQYGAPVASKAGLCFEYKVKVTSRVNCGSKLTDVPAPPVIERCVPKAHCWDPIPDDCPPEPHDPVKCPGDGPDTDFTVCMNSCDNGAYSLECSRSCYDKVYNNNNNAEKSSNYSSEFDSYAEQVINVQRWTDEKCNSLDPKPHFFVQKKSGQIKYTPANCIAPMYTGLKASLPCTKNLANGGGIPCACNCSLLCEWLVTSACQGGAKNNYLNEGEWEADKEKNKNHYENAVAKCSGFSKCSTSTATFTISAGYSYVENNETIKKTIDYPYTTGTGNKTDFAQYDDKGVKCSNKNNNTTLLPINENQCYKCQGVNSNGDISKSRTYIMEWGFPGVWVNGKSRSISFTKRAGWYKVGGQFCVPMNAKDVNRHWWNLYFIDDVKNNSAVNSSSGSSKDKNGCSINYTQCESPTEKSFEKDKITWNINASTKKFGMFGWDIDIKCFYALNSEFPKHETGTSCSSSCPNSGYTARSVNLDNLFPEEKNGQALSDPSTTGRAAGFNWTEYAKNEKTTDFVSDPEAYRTWVQTVKYDIYNDAYADKYLDYDIYLTKDDIQTIRSMKANLRGFNSIDDIGSNDDTLNPEAYIGNKSMLFYQSDLIRKVLKHVEKKPEGNAIYCNNIKDSNSCFIPGEE